MSELLSQFAEYSKRSKRIRSSDKGVFIKLFKVFVEFLNDKGYKICYRGKGNVSRQV